jgi:HEAT repeat protein
MPVTMEQVLDHLDREEPDYDDAAALLGVEALPHLATLLQGDDLARATKAASLAGAISSAESVGLLQMAATNPRPTVRVAAAAATSQLAPPEASQVLAVLLEDADAGVRKVALRAVQADVTPDVRTKIEDMATSDPSSSLRALSTEVLGRVGGGT